MRRELRIMGMSLLLAGIAAPEVPRPEPGRPTEAQYVKRTLGRGAFIGAGVGAAIGQAHNSPHEWGQGMAGFGKRFGSAFASHAVKTSIQFPVAYLLHEELRYQPSGKQGFMPRLTYALESTVITHKTNTGRSTVAAGEISGALGSGLISRLWQPASLHTLAGGFSSAGITLGADAGMNVAREFWPKHSRTSARSAGTRSALKPPIVAQRSPR